jgi:hypothetical protein
MLIPPSAITIAPTMNLALSDARKATTSAVSSGLADRLMGAFLPWSARKSRPSGPGLSSVIVSQVLCNRSHTDLVRSS